MYCPGRHVPSVSEDALHFAWSAIIETSWTQMRPHRSAPLEVSNAAAAQGAATLLLATGSEAQGSRLSGDGWLYCRYSVLFTGTAAVALAAAAAASQEGEDEAFVGSIASCGGPEGAGSEGAGSDALVAQSTCTRGPGARDVRAVAG